MTLRSQFSTKASTPIYVANQLLTLSDSRKAQPRRKSFYSCRISCNIVTIIGGVTWTAHSSIDVLYYGNKNERHGPLPFAFGYPRAGCRFSPVLLRTSHCSILLPLELIWSLTFCDCFTRARPGTNPAPINLTE